MKNLFLFVAFILTVSAAGAQSAVKLYRYSSAGNKDHFFTTNWQELREGNYGFTLEGVAGYVMTTQVSGSVPCYRYFNKNTKIHFLTTNFGELGNGAYDYTYEGIAFYAFPKQFPNTVAFHRYNNAAAKVHFYTSNWNELGNGASGYVYIGIACYIYPDEQSSVASNTPVPPPIPEKPATPESLAIKAKLALEIIRLAYESWNRSNCLYHEPVDYYSVPGGSRIKGQYLLSHCLDEKYVTIDLKWSGDQIPAASFRTAPNEFKVALVWKADLLTNIKMNGLIGFDYTVNYNQKNEFTGFTGNELVNKDTRMAQALEFNGDRLVKMTAYENDINSPSPWIRSIKTYQYSKDSVLVNNLVYKTGKPNKPQNIAGNIQATYKKINENEFLIIQPGGEIIETSYNNQQQIASKKVTRGIKTSLASYLYVDNKLFKTEVIETDTNGSYEKTVSVKFTPAVITAGMPEYEKHEGVYKFNKEGEMLYESRDMKYRKKENGVWSDWLNFRY